MTKSLQECREWLELQISGVTHVESLQRFEDVLAHINAMEQALQDFVNVCDTALPVDLVHEIGRVCAKARACLQGLEGNDEL